MRLVPLATVLIATAALMTACGGVTSPSDNKAEDFSGTVQSGMAPTYHEFTVANTGEFSVVIKSLTPLSSALLGVGYGVPAGGGQCSLLQVNVGSVTSLVLSGRIVKGPYCLSAYDYLGTLTFPEMYVITVSHP